ncbi:MAG: hypothetical protein ACYCOO_08655 [Chitinophagaceae bacterium]
MESVKIQKIPKNILGISTNRWKNGKDIFLRSVAPHFILPGGSLQQP